MFKWQVIETVSLDYVTSVGHRVLGEIAEYEREWCAEKPCFSPWCFLLKSKYFAGRPAS